jgi:hypothetical protein
MTIVIIGFGFMTEVIGIWSAVVAHFIIDVYLLTRPDVPLSTPDISETELNLKAEEDLENDPPTQEQSI